MQNFTQTDVAEQGKIFERKLLNIDLAIAKFKIAVINKLNYYWQPLLVNLFVFISKQCFIFCNKFDVYVFCVKN